MSRRHGKTLAYIIRNGKRYRYLMCGFSTKEDAERYAKTIEDISSSEAVVSDRFVDAAGFSGYAVYYRNRDDSKGIQYK